VGQALVELRAEALASLSGCLRIAAESDRQLVHGATDEQKLAWRVAVNVNKYWTAVRNTASAQRAIEVLGGNGTIETFSPLVQLYRDSMVLESWEGTHNVLVQQVLRDAARYGAHLAFQKELTESLKKLRLPDGDTALCARVEQGLTALGQGFERLAAGEGDQRFGRALVDQSAVLLQLVGMLEELAAAPGDAQKRAAIGVVADRFLRAELRPAAALPQELLGPPGL
jgi:hypothetical protein